jgi:DNA-binding transcriptional LysR family regulator
MNPPSGQPSSPLHWETQRVFLAVLRTGSLSAAARALGMAQATARRRIDELESRVGMNLFVRSPKGLMPTDTARDLIGHAEAMALAAEAFTRAASAEASVPGGTVRVTSTELVSVEILPPLLHELRVALPDLTLELSVSNKPEDLALQESDCDGPRKLPWSPAMSAIYAWAFTRPQNCWRCTARLAVIPISPDTL